MKVIFLTEVLVNYGPDFLKFLPYHQKKKKKGKNLELFKHIFETWMEAITNLAFALNDCYYYGYSFIFFISFFG